MSLLRLPDEIIFLISGLFDNPYCLNAFLQTCRRLYLLLNHSLYQGDSPYQIALKWGIENGCERTTQYALEAGAPADKFPLLYVPPTRRSPMQIACRLGNEAIVRLLLDRGVSEDSGIVGMQVAAERGHDEVIRLLVDRGFSPKGPAARGESPLNEAVRGNKLSTVKLLISLGCDPHIPGFFGPSLLFDAASLGHDEILRYLLASENIEPPLVDHLAVCAAASTGKETTLDLLLNYGASPILDRKNLKFLPLVLAAKKNHYVLAERLRGSLDLQSVIACGTPDDIDHKLLFLVSAACGWTDIVADLIDRGCPVDFEEPTYPDLGDRCAHLDCGWFIGQNSRMSPLVLAAHRGCLQVVEKLLNCNADLSAAPKLDAIASAVHGCHIKIIEILLDHSADPQHDRDESRFPVLR
ncbi:hypothetical protein N7468_001074 [Penicillium chermesinum]|uniref:Ankyrin n=1 Tax=Penicillium chermesinum TaxID=63820 RepID=A0A9W9PFY3_9EURO|nr:uncharacterized protein N7468_001074 [Penicillium chermesinum]KAJ5246091.1 hypothetical protein N7468_001074 [Penicillium chermesinum]